VDTPQRPNTSEELQADLQRLEREIEELRARLADEAAEEGRRVRSRRIARTSRAESQRNGSRGLHVIAGGLSDVPLPEARAKQHAPGDDDGPEAA
jgi:hypothetical protein